jgi:hypothetical protein
MPDRETLRRAAKDKRQGKAPSTQAGEFVREEIEHIREGKHGARSAKQAIAIGLSKARRAGVKATPSKTASKATKEKAAQDTKAAKKRSSGTATKKSTQARKSAAKRTTASKSAAAKKAAHTKGAAGRKTAAKKAARTRARNAS